MVERLGVKLTGGDHLSVTPVKKGVGVRAVHWASGSARCWAGAAGERAGVGATGLGRS